ncbi:hypothetical protein LUX57_22570 [Actinomadura madurae]|uniref:hypothetical protein n=1 Tax=Actinomadura madurae TaxID=1993 RepID=UPI0020D216A0|nr:hypothetical protein [Actinomadura madurae]MCP9967568.1 hypothetical protein [Actinomadura madurae]
MGEPDALARQGQLLQQVGHHPDGRDRDQLVRDVAGEHAGLRGPRGRQLLQVPGDVVAGPAERVGELAGPARGPFGVPRGQAHPVRAVPGEAVPDEMLVDHPLVVAAERRADLLVQPAEQLRLGRRQRLVGGDAAEVAHPVADTGQRAEPVPQRPRAPAGRGHREDVDALLRDGRLPRPQHPHRVVQPPEHLPVRLGRVDAAGDEVVDEALEGDGVRVPDLLLPVEDQLPAEVAGGEDDVHLGRFQRLDGPPGLLLGRPAEQGLGEDDRRAVPVAGAPGHPVPRAVPARVAVAAPAHLAQVHDRREVLLRPRDRVADARVAEAPPVRPQHPVQEGRARGRRPDVQVDGLPGWLVPHVRAHSALVRAPARPALLWILR